MSRQRIFEWSWAGVVGLAVINFLATNVAQALGIASGTGGYRLCFAAAILIVVTAHRVIGRQP